MTHHDNAFQNITVNSQSIELNERVTWFKKEMEQEFCELVVPKSDVIVEGNVYFSFTEDSYFDPFEYRVVGMDYKSVEAADYLVSNMKVERDGEWVIGETRWNLKDLIMEDGKIGFVISAPWLNNGGILSVDWLKIEVIESSLV